MEQNNLSVENLFSVSKDSHPYIIKAYLRKSITIETLVILDKILNLIEKYDTEVNDTIVYPDISRLVKKYRPFLKFDLEKLNGIFIRRFKRGGTED
jgi:hypothetical protein